MEGDRRFYDASLSRHPRLASANVHRLDELITQLDPAAVRQTACALLQSNLDCTHAWLYLAANGVHSLSACSPVPPAREVSFSTSSLLHQELSKGLQIRALAVFDAKLMFPCQWSRGFPERLATEQTLLSSLDAHVVVPVRCDMQVCVFFVLGPLSSGQPYEMQHLRFTEAIANQTSFSLKTAQAAVAAFQQTAETAQEQASRRSARATRGHLAPPDRFELAGLEFAAQYWTGNIPGTGFYDIVQLPRRSAMFFLAEVPGPGEDAAVRLVQLQALLRTRARAYCEDLPELLESTRRAIALSGAASPPISLFCMRYSGTNKLQFVNAATILQCSCAALAKAL